MLHVAEGDAWFDRDDALGAVEGIPDDLLDYHGYPIDAYLFADSDWREHDPGRHSADARDGHGLAGGTLNAHAHLPA